MPSGQQWLLGGRAAAGAVMVAVGAFTYPTGSFAQGTQAVPVALLVTGTFTTITAGLDVLWEHAHKADATTTAKPAVQQPPGGGGAPSDTQELTDGALVAIGAFITSMGTVLGLVTAFSSDTTDAVRVGALALVGGVVIGLTALVYMAGGIRGPSTARFVTYFVAPLMVCAAFGITCIGLSVFYR